MTRMTRHFFQSIAFILIVAVASFALNTYYVNDGSIVTLTWASTATTVGDPVIKCTTDKATGAIVGLALNTAAAAADVQVLTRGVVDVTVSANVDGIGIGDYVFAAAPGAGTSTAVLTETNTGIIYGQALEAITSGSSDRIKVLLMQSGD